MNYATLKDLWYNKLPALYKWLNAKIKKIKEIIAG